MQAFSAAPPFQRPDIVKHHVGLPVRWTGSLTAAERQGKNKIRVSIKMRPGNGGIVTCTVQQADYPWLALSPEGTLIDMEGEIEAIERLWLTLKNVTLTARAS